MTNWLPGLSSLPLPSLQQLGIVNFTTSQTELHQLLHCFLSAPCTQPQKIKFDYIDFSFDNTHTCTCKRNCLVLSIWPQLEVTERNYLHLKTAEIKHASFDVQTTLAQVGLKKT